MAAPVKFIDVTPFKDPAQRRALEELNRALVAAFGGEAKARENLQRQVVPRPPAQTRVAKAGSSGQVQPGGALRCDPTSGAFDVSLPHPSEAIGKGLTTIKNISSSTNAITIRCARATIDGAATAVINTAFGSKSFLPVGENEWGSV